MNCVVSTVKSSYVASTKFKNRGTQNSVVSFYFLLKEQFNLNNVRW